MYKRQTYTIQWVNDAVDENGNATAATVTVTDTIPEGTEYVNNSAQNATYDGDTKTLTWTIKNADPNATGTVSFRVKVTEAAVKNDEEMCIRDRTCIGTMDCPAAPEISQRCRGGGCLLYTSRCV